MADEYQTKQHQTKPTDDTPPLSPAPDVPTLLSDVSPQPGPCRRVAGEEQAVKHDMAFMHGTPNTVQYWTKRKKDLFAMIRQLGKPTAFLTLSASEMHWPDLVQLFQRLRLKPGEIEVPLEQMNSIYRAQLVNDDPVVCAIYFDRLVRVILNILRNTRVSPFRPYIVVDYFKRIEFQHRGSAHAHILLWLHNAPNEELSMLMPQTLEMANVLLSIDNGCLKRERTQVHQHTHTCYKHNTTRCRFNAPFMPVDECMVVMPFPTVDNEAQKKKIESLLNKYEAMHQALETTNYDSMEQFWEHHGVADKAEYISVLRAGTPCATIMLPRSVQQKGMILDTYACAAYMVEYVNKANRGMSNLNRAVQEIVKEKGDMAYSQALRHLGVKMLNAIELSAQEAAWCLLNQDMSEASRKVVFVNSAWPEERTRIRKSNAQMAQEGLVESSTDVWKRTMIERYEDRTNINCTRPRIWSFIGSVQKERSPQDMRIAQLDAGQQPSGLAAKKRPTSWEKQGGVTFLGGASLPSNFKATLDKGPKFAVEPRLPPPEKLSLVRSLADKVLPQDR
ncbi:uncharacterized protein ISCGN_003126 [Ixodes scapularis]